MPQVNQKTLNEKEKFGSNKKLVIEEIMNGLGKPLRTNSGPKSQKNEKTLQIRVKLTHMNKKTIS